MISVGVLGGPILGTIQDQALDSRLRAEAPAIHGQSSPARQQMPI